MCILIVTLYKQGLQLGKPCFVKNNKISKVYFMFWTMPLVNDN